ncbi:MAG: hypothetical protein WD250_15520 [Egibacteraceae bacterium]
MKIVTLRDELVPADGCVVIRGGAGTLEHDHVRGQAVENHDRYGFYGVSVFVTPPSAVADLFGDHPIGSRNCFDGPVIAPPEPLPPVR